MSLNKLFDLPIEKLSANLLAQRRCPKEGIEDLKNSIEQNGLLSPIIVRELSGDTYEIISGERRALACLALGHTHIPAIVKEADESESAVFALIANLKRKDLDYIEQAYAMHKLISIYNLTQSELGKHLSLSQSAIANKLRLLKLDSKTLHILQSYGLTERHARALLCITDENKRSNTAEYIAKKGFSVTQSEEYIKKLVLKQQQKSGKSVIFTADIRIFMNTLKNAVDFMKSAGVCINTDEYEDGDFLNVVVKIPKSEAYKYWNKTSAS